VVLGASIGMSATARAWLQPTLEFVRPLPASAVMPLAISIFGLSGGMVLAVVAFGAMWPVLLATLHGLAGVHGRLREVAEVAGSSGAWPSCSRSGCPMPCPTSWPACAWP
jgi:sulfonate transport system permease protein